MGVLPLQLLQVAVASVILQAAVAHWKPTPSLASLMMEQMM